MLLTTSIFYKFCGICANLPIPCRSTTGLIVAQKPKLGWLLGLQPGNGVYEGLA
jgi:hypothetical protein